jgi:hypothetical protein
MTIFDSLGGHCQLGSNSRRGYVNFILRLTINFFYQNYYYLGALFHCRPPKFWLSHTHTSYSF